MKLAFPAYWIEEIATTRSLEQDESRIRNAAAALHWRLIADADSKLEFCVGVNWKSWGEIVTVTLQAGKILIRSRSRLTMQCFDWGKNKENCLRLAHQACVSP
jgi:hypothetical protein